MNAERLLKHAMQEKLAITICINKVHGTRYMYMYMCTCTCTGTCTWYMVHVHVHVHFVHTFCFTAIVQYVAMHK